MAEFTEIGAEKPEMRIQTNSFPVLTANTLRALVDEGWSAVGVAATVFNQNGDVLILEHAASDKVCAGALGPVSEITKLSHRENGDGTWELIIEQPLETVQRALAEELGILDPLDIRLYANPKDTYFSFAGPIRSAATSGQAWAICPVFFILDGRAMEKQLPTRGEVLRAQFMTPSDFMNENNVRPGAKDLVRRATAIAQTTDHSELGYVEIPMSRFTTENSYDALFNA